MSFALASATQAGSGRRWLRALLSPSIRSFYRKDEVQ
jgi:hypothetical protein